MKLLKNLRDEIVPLSSRQGVILLIIIACIFQFVLFYAPALAEGAVKQAQASETNGPLIINIVSATEISTVNQRPDVISGQEINAQNEADNQIAAENTAKKLPKVIRTSTHTMTAYNSDPRQTDDSPCITANGFNVCEHGVEDTIAANFLKFGTKVMIPELFGDRVFVVRDRMNKRYPDRVDIWMKDHTDAIKFGVRVATIQVIE